MKGLEKLTNIRLAEVLTQKSVVPTDAITDALYRQDRFGEPFIESLVNSGEVTEWDLAKVVAGNFQLPFLMAGGYEITDEVKERIPKEVLFKHLIVPIDVFDKIVTVAMPILTPYEHFKKLKTELEVEFFPFVGLISENKKILSDMFKDFKEWQEEAEREREKKISQDRGSDRGDDWMNIFDTGDAQVRDGLPEED